MLFFFLCFIHFYEPVSLCFYVLERSLLVQILFTFVFTILCLNRWFGFNFKSLDLNDFCLSLIYFRYISFHKEKSIKPRVRFATVFHLLHLLFLIFIFVYFIFDLDALSHFLMHSFLFVERLLLFLFAYLVLLLFFGYFRFDSYVRHLLHRLHVLCPISGGWISNFAPKTFVPKLKKDQPFIFHGYRFCCFVCFFIFFLF